MKTWIMFFLILIPLCVIGQNTNSIGIKEWHWTKVSCTDGDVISIDYIMTNTTPYKVINAKFEVFLWGASSDIIINDSKLLVNTTRIDLTDNSYDFCPSNSIHKSSVSVGVKKYAGVKSVTLTLISYDKVEMTKIDTALMNVYRNIKYREDKNIEVPDQWYEMKNTILNQKKKLKSINQ